VEEIWWIIRQIHARWPRVRVLLRADSGFVREALMAWCEANRADDSSGLARNERLVAGIAAGSTAVASEPEASEAPGAFAVSRVDAGHLKPNPARDLQGRVDRRRGQYLRFVVTSLKPGRGRNPAASTKRSTVPEARLRTVFKERLLNPFAGGPSVAAMRVNQLHLWLASAAAVRRIGLASCNSPPHRRFHPAEAAKIGALLRVSVRRITIAMASACPRRHEFAPAHGLLRRAAA
jgi:hypothetical protein